jgi:thioredoxin reductase
VDLVEARPRIDCRFEVAPRALSRAGDGVGLELEGPGGSAVEEADLALAAVGRRSRAPELLNDLDLPPVEAVSAGLPGLFVAGDVRRGTLGQAGVAIGDGLAAAMAAVAHVEEAGARR